MATAMHEGGSAQRRAAVEDGKEQQPEKTDTAVEAPEDSPAQEPSAASQSATPPQDLVSSEPSLQNPVSSEPVTLEPAAISAVGGAAPLREIAFIDSAVDNWQFLAEGVRPGVEVFMLRGDQDRLSQILDVLSSQRSGIDAVHILSHGVPGQVMLRGSVLSLETLDQRGGELARLGKMLSSEGDILLYGCNVGEGDTGAAFTARLARITGADVSASIDATGLTGNWTLEQATGPIEAKSALTESAMAAYDGTLENASSGSEEPADASPATAGETPVAAEEPSAAAEATASPATEDEPPVAAEEPDETPVVAAEELLAAEAPSETPPDGSAETIPQEAPEIAQDVHPSGAGDIVVTITAADLLANATDANGNSLSVVDVHLADGASGTLAEAGNDTWTLTPDADWSGALDLVYGVSDGTTTVETHTTLEVDPVADVPTLAVIVGEGVAMPSVDETATPGYTEYPLEHRRLPE